MTSFQRLTFAIAMGWVVLTARGADWPQYRGPLRDGVSRETGLLKEWPGEGPRLLWKVVNLGLGYSGPAVVGDRLYVSCGRGDSEFVVAMDLSATGIPRELWATKIGPLFTWRGNNWNVGPNATPTVDRDLVFALGGNGDLVCVDAATGRERWHKCMPRDFAGEVNPIGGGAEEPTPLGWGYAWAPLVDGDQLICLPGGKQGLMAALDRKTGKTIWRSTDVVDQATYSSPIAVEIAGLRQYVQVVNSGVVGISAQDGKRLWAYQRKPAYGDVVTATPLFNNNHVFSTVGFGEGCDLIKLIPGANGVEVEKVYSNRQMQSRDGGVVLFDGHIYGYSESHGWMCMDFKTGKVLWSEKQALGRGSVMVADGHLYCCAEKGGTIALIEASPTARRETGRLTLPTESPSRPPSGGLWTHPVIADGRLYLRDEEFLYCYDIKMH